MRSKPFIDSRNSYPWLVIGGGPTACDEVIEMVCDSYPNLITITTNAGLQWNTDYYFLSDRDACKAYGELTLDIEPRPHLITLKRSGSALLKRGMAHFDEYLELEKVHANSSGRAYPIRYVPGKFVSVGYSGLYCLQYAANFRPPKIIMIGFEGYTEDYADGKKYRSTMDSIGPFTQDLINKCSYIEFEVWGELVYPLKAPNLTVVECEVLHDTDESEI